MRRLRFTLALAAVAALLVPVAAQADVPWFQGFEGGSSSGWVPYAQGLTTPVASGTNGVTSNSGSYHAIVHPGSPGSYGYNIATGNYTRFNAYQSTWPGDYAFYMRLDFFLDNNITEGLGWQEELWYNCGITDVLGSYAGESSLRLRKNDTAGNWDLKSFAVAGAVQTAAGIAGDQWVQHYVVIRKGSNGFVRADVVNKDTSGNVLQKISADTSVANTDIGGNRFGWLATWDMESSISGSYTYGTTPGDWAPGYGLGIPVDNTRSVTLIPGDANLDDIVNILDLSKMSGNWQQTTTAGYWDGDFNEDGVVNILDLSLLSGNWQDDQSVSAPISLEASAGASLGAVPEPGTLLLLGAGSLLMLRRRRH